MVENMKAVAFGRITDKQWREAVKASLRGESLDSLVTKSVEGIDIQPLYTKESIKQKELHAQIRNIIHCTKYNNEWLIAQPSYQQEGTSFIKRARASLTKGNE